LAGELAEEFATTKKTARSCQINTLVNTLLVG
jgi:hypothetical protein